MNLYHVLEAVGILVSGLLFYSYTYSWLPVTRPEWRRWRAALNGIAFGAIAVTLMIARIEVAPGLFIDARLVPVALVVLFEGWPAAVIAATCAAAYRLWLGGSGAPAGLVTLALAAGAAGLVHALARRRGRVGPRDAFLLTALVFLSAVTGFLLLGRRGQDLLAPVLVPYLITLVIGIGFLARLFHDVAEQHRLAADRQRYRDILDEAQDVVRIIDPDTLRILDTNRADASLSGYSREEILQRTVRDFWPDEARERAEREALFAELRAHGHADALGVGYRTRSGGIIRIDVTYRLLTYQGRRYAIAIFHDAARRLAAETAHREAAELRAATLLARAAAHEIHNPLAVIVGYLQLLRPRLPADGKEVDWVRQMLEATVRIREAVERLNRLIRIESTAPTGGAPAMLDTLRSAAAVDGGPPRGAVPAPAPPPAPAAPGAPPPP